MATKKAKLSMKEELLNLVKGMEKDGYDFEATPALFKWVYKENPDIAFDLLIQKAQPEGTLAKVTKVLPEENTKNEVNAS